MVGFTVAVSDLARAGELLDTNGIPHQEVGGRLVVSAADACGSAVLFET